MQPKSIIVCTGHSFQDPLFQGLIYQYLLGVHRECPNEYLFHIFTEEQAAYKMAPEQQKQLQQDLRSQGVYWYPIPYRSGRFMLLKKLWNFLVLFFTIFKIKWRFKARLILGFLAIAGGYAYIASVFLRLKLAVFCFEPHSRYMADFGIWSPKSLKYKLLNKMEFRQATRANYVVVPTIHTVELLKQWKSRAQVFRVPISVDTDKFIFKPESRQQFRQQFGIENRYALMYLGKFGGIYYNAEVVAKFFKQLVDFDASIFIFTITPDDTAQVRQTYLDAGLQESDFVVLDKIPYSQIEGYISACDMGLVAIPPLDSQKYRTPVKIGNYLACGLPYIVNRGVADDDLLAEKERVGVVLESLEAADIHRALPALRQMMDEPREAQRQRCRQAAIEHRGMHNSINVLKQIFAQ